MSDIPVAADVPGAKCAANDWPLALPEPVHAS